MNSILNLFYVLALQAAADMTGETEYLEKARRVMRLIREKFFDREKGLYAIDPERRFFSEHSQVLAMLTGPDAQLAENLRLYDGKLTPCSIYFSFYYLQACAKYGLHDLADKRLERWKALKKEGLTTFPEEFGNPRSDCHAWSSHILCYLRTAIPGNRPDMKSAGREREKEILRA